MSKLAMLVAATAILGVGVLLPTKADAGCYRLGETGYHWYKYCAGPDWVYPRKARLSEWPLLVSLERSYPNSGQRRAHPKYRQSRQADGVCLTASHLEVRTAGDHCPM